MRKFFKNKGTKVHSYMNHYLHGANEVKNNSGEYHKVFTPYYNKWLELDKPTPITVTIDSNKVIKEPIFKEDEQKIVELAEEAALDIEYDPGTEAARKQLDLFIDERLDQCKKTRDFPNRKEQAGSLII